MTPQLSAQCGAVGAEWGLEQGTGLTLSVS